MKIKKYCIIILALLIFILNSCCSDYKTNTTPTIVPTIIPTVAPTPCTTATPAETEEPINTYNAEHYMRQWYDRIINGLNQEAIQISVEQNNAIAEYRIIYDYSFVGIFYYSLKVYEDGTGEFAFMVFNSEFFDLGELIIDEKSLLTEDETNSLLNAINDNDFGNIPAIHPDEGLGLDGYTIFIEGYSNKELHLITMWEPKKEYNIYKIAKVFRDFSKIIADNPLEEQAW